EHGPIDESVVVTGQSQARGRHHANANDHCRCGSPNRRSALWLVDFVRSADDGRGARSGPSRTRPPCDRGVAASLISHTLSFSFALSIRPPPHRRVGMLKRPPVVALLTLALGALLGYAAASGKFNLFKQPGATAAPQDRPAAQKADEDRPAKSNGKKPNIIIIWGDDIGQSNLSCYTKGLMGYQTPNIDRLAKEGMHFTDYYGEPSCTAGRASFITGQHGLRTGLTKVGLPGATLGLRKEDPTIAELLKPHGYATAQIGKNHLGDRNEFLPTAHGFDEFYGNLYHLNAEEEPEHRDYPKDPAFRKKYGPRGVLECKATDREDAPGDAAFGRVGKQTIKDTGPLTRKRMEPIDDDTARRSVEYIKRQSKAGKPFFLWVNFPHMHLRTHVKPASKGQ